MIGNMKEESKESWLLAGEKRERGSWETDKGDENI